MQPGIKGNQVGNVTRLLGYKGVAKVIRVKKGSQVEEVSR